MESHLDQIARVEMMAENVKDGTWDLSDNDIAALRAVLGDRAELLAALKRVVQGLRNLAEFGIVLIGYREEALRRAAEYDAVIAKVEGR